MPILVPPIPPGGFTDEQVAVALLALLNISSVFAYDLDDARKLTAPLPAGYAEIYATRRDGGNEGRVAHVMPATVSYRAVCRSIGSTVSNAREIGRRISLIEGQMLTVDGVESTPIKFETAVDIGQDGDGLWSGTSSWTFTF